MSGMAGPIIGAKQGAGWFFWKEQGGRNDLYISETLTAPHPRPNPRPNPAIFPELSHTNPPPFSVLPCCAWIPEGPFSRTRVALGTNLALGGARVATMRRWGSGLVATMRWWALGKEPEGRRTREPFSPWKIIVMCVSAWFFSEKWGFWRIK